MNARSYEAGDTLPAFRADEAVFSRFRHAGYIPYTSLRIPSGDGPAG